MRHIIASDMLAYLRADRRRARSGSLGLGIERAIGELIVLSYNPFQLFRMNEGGRRVTPHTLSPRAANVLGKIGQPAPLRELAARRWDAIVVGAGHNALTCAAY